MKKTAIQKDSNDAIKKGFLFFIVLAVATLLCFLSLLVANQRAPQFIIDYCFIHPEHKCVASAVYYGFFEPGVFYVALIFLYLFLRKIKFTYPFFVMLLGVGILITLNFSDPMKNLFQSLDYHYVLKNLLRSASYLFVPFLLSYVILSILDAVQQKTVFHNTKEN